MKELPAWRLEMGKAVSLGESVHRFGFGGVEGRLVASRKSGLEVFWSLHSSKINNLI